MGTRHFNLYVTRRPGVEDPGAAYDVARGDLPAAPALGRDYLLLPGLHTEVEAGYLVEEILERADPWGPALCLAIATTEPDGPPLPVAHTVEAPAAAAARRAFAGKLLAESRDFTLIGDGPPAVRLLERGRPRVQRRRFEEGLREVFVVGGAREYDSVDAALAAAEEAGLRHVAGGEDAGGDGPEPYTACVRRVFRRRPASWPYIDEPGCPADAVADIIVAPARHRYEVTAVVQRRRPTGALAGWRFCGVAPDEGDPVVALAPGLARPG